MTYSSEHILMQYLVPVDYWGWLAVFLIVSDLLEVTR